MKPERFLAFSTSVSPATSECTLFYECSVLLAAVAKNLGSKKKGTIDSARDEKNEVSAKTSYRKP